LCGDTDKALALLRLLQPDGPWQLTAIDPDNGTIETRENTFLHGTDASADITAALHVLYHDRRASRRKLSSGPSTRPRTLWRSLERPKPRPQPEPADRRATPKNVGR